MMEPEYIITCASSHCTANKLKRPCLLGSAATWFRYLPYVIGIFGCRVSKSMPSPSAVLISLCFGG